MSAVAAGSHLALVPANVGPEIITISEVMLDAIADADRYAVRGMPVLLVGETGTGKELLARRIHARSDRRGDLVPVNCAELRPEQAANLLFGHRRGSYTGATESTIGHVRRSSRGTLFLDEVTSLPLETQPTLLRVLETGEVTPYGADRAIRVDLRVVAAVQPAIRRMLVSGAVRQDLIERLAASTVVLPPLRERPDDIVPLASAFALQNGCRLASAAAHRLLDHVWPGNVRELRWMIEGAAALANDGKIGVAELMRVRASRLAAVAEPSDERRPAEERHVERRQLIEACRDANGDWRRALALTGMSRTTLYRKLTAHGLRLQDFRFPTYSRDVPGISGKTAEARPEDSAATVDEQMT